MVNKSLSRAGWRSRDRHGAAISAILARADSGGRRRCRRTSGFRRRWRGGSGLQPHDIAAIMAFFAEDCSLDLPRGPEPRGSRLAGREAVRRGLTTRVETTPDVHYAEIANFVDGDTGMSKWRLTGTTPAGETARVPTSAASRTARWCGEFRTRRSWREAAGLGVQAGLPSPESRPAGPPGSVRPPPGRTLLHRWPARTPADVVSP